MKRKTIIEKLPLHSECFNVILSATIYVRDYKHHDLSVNDQNRGIVIDANPDPEWSSVVLHNSMPDQLSVESDCFPENALPNEEVGSYASQCECVIFPADGNDDDWVLFIETKYTDNAETAQRSDVNYPKKMFSQIKSTVRYFRNKGILSENKKVHAIMSYPKLLEPFDSWNFPLEDIDEETGDVIQLTTEDVLQRYKIHLRSTNHALIKSAKRIKLGISQ